MKLLITGGAGFIGSNFVRYILKNHAEYEILVLDALTYAGNMDNLNGIMDKITFVQGDITEKDAVFGIFNEYKPDIAVNFAAQTHVDRSIDAPGIFTKTNISGMQILMDACIKYGIKRFHQISTDEVYGDLPLDRRDLRFNEKDTLNPSSPYSASKAAADLLAMAYYRTYKLPVTISRCSNNYGAYQFPEKLIPLMIFNALNNKPLPVYGSGQNVRDWIYADDHCRAVDMIIHKGRAGQIYNVGADCEIANIDMVKMLLEELNKPQSLITYVDDRPGHDLRYAVDASKIRNELGWRPQTDITDGLKKTVRWYMENYRWLLRVQSGEYMRQK